VFVAKVCAYKVQKINYIDTSMDDEFNTLKQMFRVQYSITEKTQK